ncbi:MAG: 50S ribosomal protein L23 [Bdellovibrionales bacterium]|nr:50S ribosomal protein L23 [Bdellovibrionales bacterium]
MSQLIKRPLLTEKNNVLASKNIYVFKVDRSANKAEIKQYVEKYFDVKVRSVKTAICRGRSRRTKIGYGRVKYWKKAIVRLAPGETVNLFEGN